MKHFRGLFMHLVKNCQPNEHLSHLLVQSCFDSFRQFLLSEWENFCYIYQFSFKKIDLNKINELEGSQCDLSELYYIHEMKVC